MSQYEIQVLMLTTIQHTPTATKAQSTDSGHLSESRAQVHRIEQ
jgi:hypothetical protein